MIFHSLMSEQENYAGEIVLIIVQTQYFMATRRHLRSSNRIIC
jgi:hypothetical protein